MKVSGFTFVKNAVKYGYPVVESISSLLPIVDEMIVCLGDSEDQTNALIASIGSEKIKTVHSVWDKNLWKDAGVLAAETNKAMDAVSPDSDWLFYIQADEVLHEQYHEMILSKMKKYLDDKNVEGMLFHYHHFYGSYKFIGDGRKWYSKEIRVIRNNPQIRSYKDAQGFQISGRKLKVKLINAYIYHYGWARNPVIMQRKFFDFGRLWHPVERHTPTEEEIRKKDTGFDYSAIDSVTLFKGTHPAVMKKLVESEDWEIGIDVQKKKFKNFKQRALYLLWKKFGIRPFEYRNYKKI